MEKIEERNTCYEKGGYETVMFVDATPNRESAKACEKALKDSKLKIRVVESYIGETARSIGERTTERITKYENNEQNSVFYKHMVEQHDTVKQELSINILAKCPNDAMLRQVTEAVFINESSWFLFCGWR